MKKTGWLALFLIVPYVSAAAQPAPMVSLTTTVTPTVVVWDKPVTFRAELKGISSLPAGSFCAFTFGFMNAPMGPSCPGMPFAFATFKQQGRSWIAEVKVTFPKPNTPQATFTAYVSSVAHLPGTNGPGHMMNHMGGMQHMSGPGHMGGMNHMIWGTTVPLVFPTVP